jgi:hypothetical protein
MRYLSVVGDYFRQIHFAEIKSSLRMTGVNVNFTAEAGIFSMACGRIARRISHSKVLNVVLVIRPAPRDF